MKELKNRDIPYKIYLSEDEMPRYWYNVRADMKNKPAPLLNPGTLKPMTAEEMGHVFCAELVKQEMDNDTALIPIGAHLLQVRGQQHLRQPQAELCHRSGLLRQGAGSDRRDHGDRCRPVGHGAEHGLRLSGAGLPCVHGEVLL